MTDQQWVEVGQSRVLGVLDARVDYPWALAELFPGVPDEAWEPFRERYPDAFGAPTVWRSSYRCFLIRSEGRTILLDMDPERERATRRDLLERLEAEAMLFAASHFPEPAFGRVVRTDGRRYWDPASP